MSFTLLLHRWDRPDNGKINTETSRKIYWMSLGIFSQIIFLWRQIGRKPAWEENFLLIIWFDRNRQISHLAAAVEFFAFYRCGSGRKEVGSTKRFLVKTWKLCQTCCDGGGDGLKWYCNASTICGINIQYKHTFLSWKSLRCYLGLKNLPGFIWWLRSCWKSLWKSFEIKEFI